MQVELRGVQGRRARAEANAAAGLASAGGQGYELGRREPYRQEAGTHSGDHPRGVYGERCGVAAGARMGLATRISAYSSG